MNSSEKDYWYNIAIINCIKLLYVDNSRLNIFDISEVLATAFEKDKKSVADHIILEYKHLKKELNKWQKK